MMNIILHAAPGRVPDASLAYLAGCLEFYFGQKPRADRVGTLEIHYGGHFRVKYLAEYSADRYDVFLF